MKCPNCGSWNQHCIDTMPSKDGNGRRRRRECHDCGHRFNTIETVERQSAQEGEQVLRDVISADILRHIIDGECRITGIVTDHEKKKMFVEYTFYEEDKP